LPIATAMFDCGNRAASAQPHSPEQVDWLT
jgi:hypothetical protein